MIDHYNAFISYRHADQDIKVAKAIQSDLEHFHVPRKIQKTTGLKKINRIFLDKDELGAASDLSAEISYALEHADHLIVICSTATRESAWVPREIEYFLRNHSRSQITTVLVNGEPEDVIPDILKYEDRTYQNEYGQEYTVRVPLEPLSCDYRLPRSKAKKLELPRLASKLLSCSYDELMNRRRAYKMRRLSLIFAAVLAVMLGFGGYLLYSRNKIRTNLEDSLRNQSLYLANESMFSSANEQRILALQLALEALPRDEEDLRPVTPQAMRALTDATLAYTTSYGYGIETTWNYRMPDRFEKDQCALSESGKELAAWDRNGDIKIWSTTSHEELFSMHDPYGVESVRFLPNGRILVCLVKGISVYQISDGTRLWTIPEDQYFYTYSSIQITSDDTMLVRASNLSGAVLQEISLSDGTVKKSYNLPAKIDDETLFYSKYLLSPDGKNLALTYETGDFKKQSLMLYELGSETYRSFSTDEVISSIFWGDSSHILVTSWNFDKGSSSSIGNSHYFQTDRITIRCIGTATMTERWNHEFISTDVATRSDFIALPKNEAVLYFHGNRAEIYRVSDGGKIANYNVNAPIIMAQDPDGDGWPFFVTSTGLLVFPNTTESANATEYFMNGLSDIFFRTGMGFIAHPANSSEILQYGLFIHDEEFSELQRGLDLNNAASFFMNDRVLAFLSVDPQKEGTTQTEDTILLSLADPNTGELMYQIPVQDEQQIYTFNTELLGTWGNHFYMGYPVTGDGYRILDVDLSSGETETIVLVKEESVSSDFCTLLDGKLYYCCRGGAENIQLYVYDLATGETTSHKIRDDLTHGNVWIAPVPIPLLNAVFLSINDEHYFVYLDGSPTKTPVLPEGWRSTQLAINVVDQRIALSDKSRVRITDLDGRETIDIACPSAPLGITFYNSGKKGEATMLLAACSSGTLYRYDAATGELLGKTDLTESLSNTNNVVFTFDTESHLLYMQNGDCMSVVDTEIWYEELYLRRCLGYHAPSDRFYAYAVPDSNTMTPGYFRHYSLEDLINKAESILQGTEMPDEVKAEYGIELNKEEP